MVEFVTAAVVLLIGMLFVLLLPVFSLVATAVPVSVVSGSVFVVVLSAVELAADAAAAAAALRVMRRKEVGAGGLTGLSSSSQAACLRAGLLRVLGLALSVLVREGVFGVDGSRVRIPYIHVKQRF